MDVFSQQQKDVIDAMQMTLAKLEASDPATLTLLAGDKTSSLAGLDPEPRRLQAIQSLKDSITEAEAESVPEGHPYHSRDALTGLIQSQIEDNVIPELQATGQGNPVVWIPAGVLGVLEHFRTKYPFQTATAASRIQIPNNCKIALLADWGADNIHAARLGKLAIAKGADYVIHLGDIYYSGTEGECLTFLQNWPLKQPNGTPVKGKSFALNGNHEMYSLGRPYFTIVLPAFGQEASYFTLFNDNWQIHGLDTAYVPFSIGGGTTDTRLQIQSKWLTDNIKNNPTKRNILLTHNQPVSAHLPEFQQAQTLMNEARQLLQQLGGTAFYGWFFGHEHRCTIYKDDDPGALFRARLIGNGSIAHHPQEEVKSEADETGATTTPFLKVNSRALDEDKQVAVSTFAMLTFTGTTIQIQYIDEDDRLFYEETWDANKKLW
jgi:predicted phosphodiesterase